MKLENQASNHNHSQQHQDRLNTLNTTKINLQTPLEPQYLENHANGYLRP
jgi:hypothetical protein